MNRLRSIGTQKNSNFEIVQMLRLWLPLSVINLLVWWLCKISNFGVKPSRLWNCRIFSKKVILPNVVGFGIVIFGLFLGFFYDLFLGNQITPDSFDCGTWSCLSANLIIILWIYARRLWSLPSSLVRKLTRSIKSERFERIAPIFSLFTSAPIKPEHRPPIRIFNSSN